MSSLAHLHLFPSVLDARAWSLSSSGLFTVESFFLVLSHHSNPTPFFPTNCVWKSQVSFKVRSFVWLVAHKNVNTNDMLQLKRSYKTLSPNICKLCMEYRESVDHLFLHCPLALGLWYRLFRLAKMDWVPPKSICDMMIISYEGLESSMP